MANEKLARDWDRIILRVPDGMRERLANRAKTMGMSMNSMIIEMLTDGLEFGGHGRLIRLMNESLRIGEQRDALLAQAQAMTDHLAILQDEIRDMKTFLVNAGIAVDVDLPEEGE